MSRSNFLFAAIVAQAFFSGKNLILRVSNRFFVLYFLL